jgi:hypothetical protein
MVPSCVLLSKCPEVPPPSLRLCLVPAGESGQSLVAERNKDCVRCCGLDLVLLHSPERDLVRLATGLQPYIPTTETESVWGRFQVMPIAVACASSAALLPTSSCGGRIAGSVGLSSPTLTQSNPPSSTSPAFPTLLWLCGGTGCFASKEITPG